MKLFSATAVSGFALCALLAAPAFAQGSSPAPGGDRVDANGMPTTHSTPAEQAYPLIFLGSDAAGYINGHALNVDGGFVGAVATGQIDLQAELGKVMGAS